MSWQAVVYVRDLRGLTGTEKAVAYSIAARHDTASDVAWPSVATIAEDAGLTDRAVKKAIKSMRERGVLGVEVQWDEAGDRASNRYRFPLLGVVNVVHHPVNGVPQGSEPRSPQVVNHVPQGSEPRSPKKYIEKSPEKAIEKDIRVAEVFTHYCQRVQPKAQLTAQARTHIQARLKRFSVADLKAGIDHFADDYWWPSRNGARGAAWFFKNDDRAEQFLRMTPRPTPPTYGHASHGKESPNGVTSQPAPADDRFAAFRKFG